MCTYIFFAQHEGLVMNAKADKYSQLPDCSCNMIRRSARRITQFYENTLREAGIKPTQFTILAALANTGPVQLTQLADKLLLERTGLTRNLNVLERNGWVRVETGEEDSRQRIVSLTEEGYVQLDNAIPYWQKAQTKLVNEMGQDRITELQTSLDDMSKAITS